MSNQNYYTVYSHAVSSNDITIGTSSTTPNTNLSVEDHLRRELKSTSLNFKDFRMRYVTNDYPSAYNSFYEYKFVNEHTEYRYKTTYDLISFIKEEQMKELMKETFNE